MAWAAIQTSFMGKGVPAVASSALTNPNTSAVSAVAFRMLGLHKSIQVGYKPKWRRKSIIFLSLCTLLLLVPLSQNLSIKKKTGQSRPLTLPVAADTRNQVHDFLALHPNVELILIGRSSVEPSSGVMVILSAYEQLEKSFSNDLRRVIRQSRGEEGPVKVIVLKGEKQEEDQLNLVEKSVL